MAERGWRSKMLRKLGQPRQIAIGGPADLREEIVDLGGKEAVRRQDLASVDERRRDALEHDLYGLEQEQRARAGEHVVEDLLHVLDAVSGSGLPKRMIEGLLMAQ